MAAFDSLGRKYPDEQIDEMIAEGNGQINFVMFITLIGEKILGKFQLVRPIFLTFD